MKTTITTAVLALLLSSHQCTSISKSTESRANVVKPKVITQQVKHDTDDPAIWVHPEDTSKSLIIGTDKDSDGGLFVFNLDGVIVNKVTDIKRPNNVDIEYGFKLGNQTIDIALTTERERNQVRIFSLPNMKEVGAFSVFDGEEHRSPMGISIYKNPSTGIMYAIVGRKSGPKDNYIWQYKLVEKNGKITGELVRKFGKYSGIKEIEAIAVDDELGYIYYSDEQYGIHQYYADPEKGNQSIAVFGQGDFLSDIEGISIYPTSSNTGYILVSNQQADTFNVYRRENPTAGKIAEIPVSTKESDGSEASAVNFGDKFPKGIFVAMSNGKVFHIYDWRDIEERILQKDIRK
ncbi:phytase [Riemerella anatipestifer]|uniref:Phytase n=1 Tax=Riemerella anatipestifer TaxID=34085 RepID=A0AAP6LLR8_RIEAN|nr:phytase [Riemerella anatipestifer]MBT0550022.1 phytase [Riemerella anatipestifer]MBT0555009.1 phytase [Riemerella anatipestifer]MBT0560747.1 phytase [Riemerella anatipestifer]MCD5969016.1 phytase [Riemerella anatipestifer]MCO7355437.1 phytase [Riemerella anatipestifer]